MPNKRISDLLEHFPEYLSGKKIVKKSDLKKYAETQIPDVTEQEFRSVMYQLTNQSNIISSGSGFFLVRDTKNNLMSNRESFKNRFKSTPSNFLLEIISEIKRKFADLAFTIWETRELNQFMVHQPFVNMVIIEVEKDLVESLFNTFSDIYPGKTFLSPDQLVIERYVMQQKEALIISKSITQTPRGRMRDTWPSAKLEKMLVDIFVNKDLFLFYQGSEMITIFEEAFKKYIIDEPSLFRYAGRRNAAIKLKEFIQKKTNIELLTIPKQGDNNDLK